MSGTKSWQKRIYWGSVENLSMAKGWSIEDLSRIYWADRNHKKFDSMDRRSCQEAIEKKPRNLDGLRICLETVETWRRKLDRKESIKEVSSLKKEGFSRREKHIEINATYKLLKQTSKSHIKLSKRLLTYKHRIHRSKHTHTINNSNQFYISKTS